MVLPALLAFVALPVVAGHSGDHYKCTKSTQACLDEMAAGMKNHGWLGIEMDKSESGELSIKRVVSGSPAESAGFVVGDVLIAMNGIKYGDEKNKEALMAAKKTMAPGKQATYTISRNGSEKKLTATLAEVPSEVLAQWIGGHMLEHATSQIATK